MPVSLLNKTEHLPGFNSGTLHPSGLQTTGEPVANTDGPSEDNKLDQARMSPSIKNLRSNISRDVVRIGLMRPDGVKTTVVVILVENKITGWFRQE